MQLGVPSDQKWRRAKGTLPRSPAAWRSKEYARTLLPTRTLGVQEPGTRILPTRFGTRVSEIRESRGFPRNPRRGLRILDNQFPSPKIDTLDLLAPEIGPGDVLIATARIRRPGAQNLKTSDPFLVPCSGVAEFPKIRRNFGNSENCRKIAGGGLRALGNQFSNPKNRHARAFSSRNRARRRDDHDPPNPTPRCPESGN